MDVQTTKSRLRTEIAPGENKFPYYGARDIFHAHERGRAAGTAVVLESHKIAYVPIPKNACTSMKAMFFELQNGKPAPRNFNQVHNLFGRRAINFKRFAADKNFFKFVIIRDPVERFVSAYNNRVIWHNELSEGWMKKHRPHEAVALEKKSLRYHPDINEFARRLNDYIEISQAIRHHFIWQRRFFMNQPEVFDKIYTVWQLPELVADLSERLRRPVVLPNVQETKSMKSAIRVADIGGKELSLIIQYYVEDYETLRPYLKRAAC